MSLTQTPSDNLANWADAVDKVLKYLKAITDSRTMSDATVRVLGKNKDVGGDNLNNWAEVIAKVLHWKPQLSDNLNAWGELVTVWYQYRKTFSDAGLNNWLDSSPSYLVNISLQEFEDRFLFADHLKVEFHHRLSAADNQTLLDSLRITYEFLISKADSFSQSDAVVKSTTRNLTISVGEALSMSDSLNNFNSTSFIEYLRRYLNDKN